MKPRGHFRATTDHPAVAAAARAERGTWFLAAVYGTMASARTVVRRVPRAEQVPSYAPAGSFEAYAALHSDGYAVWVRYVAGDDPVPALPETMAVRVCDRGPGPGYSGVCIVTVTVRALCPTCGGPRGVDTVRNHRFHEDGDWYSVDVWDNPCGHVDSYAVVLREARSPVPPAPVVRSADFERCDRRAEAVALIITAADQRRVHHAMQAAQVLDENGHQEAGDLIRAEIKARHGHMSARQAAGFLRDSAPLTSSHDGTGRKDSHV
ncbi:hypothetical protein [Actinacidiphila sp. ITFR-21]|uniref:hypothetical protein n=1 Tax=Actinacidiphila sp. ITFR-21 TaxID=3075199 RepID=UPI00288943D4|nr:hypothetical protein [Streptomyces sp. ITFR-21]WNI20316.1 hypothetical protein RLT57_33145 [Streptomyces sp. ITFR-21]